MGKLQEVAAPKYEVRSLIGYGGMAGVYLAHETRLGRDVAIKVMSPSLMMDEALVNRFEQEARTTAQLSHPNIVTILDVEQSENLHYFAMTYVPGRTLAQVMTSAGARLPLGAVATWITQVASALDYAHRRGVIHRDIKPGNIIMDAEGDAHVTDFGIAKVAKEPSLTRTGMLVGTPSYMSPEQCMSGGVTSVSDQYALGAVAYQMLTGEPPFTGPTLAVMQAHVYEAAQPIAELRPECPVELSSTVERMLEKNPEDRWPSLSDVIDQISPHVPSRTDPSRPVIAEMGRKVWGLTVESPQSPITAGDAVPLDATPHDLHGRPLTSRKVDWRSSDPAIAAIQERGLVAVQSGTATVTARCEGVTEEVVLQVGEPGSSPTPSDPTSPVSPATASMSPALAATSGATPGPSVEAAGETVALPAEGAGPGPVTVPGVGAQPADAEVKRRPRWVLGAAAGLVLVAGLAGVVVLGTFGETDTPPLPTVREPSPGTDGGAEPRLVDPSAPTSTDGALTLSRSGLPAGAEIYMSGEDLAETLVSEDSIVLPAGTYRLRAEAPGYLPDALQIDLASGVGRSWAPVLEAISVDPVAVRPAPAAAPAVDGLIRVLGELPPGARVVVGGPTLDDLTLDADSVALPAGAYRIRATAPGYLADELEMDLVAGTTSAWTPSLQPDPVALEPDVPPTEPEGTTPGSQVTTPDPAVPIEAPAADPALVRNGVQVEVEGLAALVQARDADAAIAAYPGASQWIEGIRALLQSNSVQDLSASVVGVELGEFGDGQASADFGIRLAFRQSTGRQQPTYRFSGTFSGSDGGWALTGLTVTEVTPG